MSEKFCQECGNVLSKYNPYGKRCGNCKKYKKISKPCLQCGIVNVSQNRESGICDACTRGSDLKCVKCGINKIYRCNKSRICKSCKN